MRLANAIKGDVKFQFKQGFYLVYLLVTAVYIAVLQKIPAGTVRQYLLPITIFTDPAIVGFFFIGGIVMLEKQQGVLSCLAVTPLSPREYLLSKAVSFGALALCATAAITLAVNGLRENLFLLLAGVLLSSVFFTLYGFLAACGCRTVNGYFVRAVPLMLLAVLPCFALVGFPYSWLFRGLPGVAGLHLAIGAFIGIPVWQALADLTVLAVWTVVLFAVAQRAYDRNIIQGGGAE